MRTAQSLVFAFVLLAAGAASASAQEGVKSTPAKPKAVHETQAQLQRVATVKLVDATATAQKAVPGAKLAGHELERENGKLIYSFDFKIAGKSGEQEVNIDAMTGELISNTHESPADEAREKAAAKKKTPTTGTL